MHSPTMPLTDPPPGSPVADSVMWVQQAALGSTATLVAVIAVAAVGIAMLSGRLELRRGIAVVIGCFILFEASSIAAALSGLASSDRSVVRQTGADAGQLSDRLQSPPSPSTAYDPYAGASVPLAR